MDKVGHIMKFVSVTNKIIEENYCDAFGMDVIYYFNYNEIYLCKCTGKTISGLGRHHQG